MFPFFESIRFTNDVAENLFFHQQRVERTFQHYGQSCKLDLLEIDFQAEAATIGELKEIVFKCRIQYDLLGNYQISFTPYQIRKIHSFSFFEIGSQDYPIKLSDRTWINEAVKSVDTDDLVFVKQGVLKDASYANIVLFDGKDWVTPASPLLFGTMRAKLLNEKKIIEREISIDQLKNYRTIKFINAMMTWEESPTIELR